jgi:hypothetical protein
MIRLLCLLVALAGPATAETAGIMSGEHAGFTRLVVELPSATEWKVGRMPMGYGFATLAPVQPEYDLTRVWDRIPRSRLQALRVDPETGALLLTVGCDCHVLPFEYQPGIVVLDIRTGPPPAGSEFEDALTFAGEWQRRDRAPTLRPTGYDWLAASPSAGADTKTAVFPFPALAARSALDPLRDELLRQLSRGAADGVVDMALPGKTIGPEVEGMGDLSGALIRIGALPGLEIDGALEQPEADDDGCIADEAVNLSDWGGGRRPADLLAEARNGLFGEFDTPSRAALERAVRLHLYLGFGAEAAQYADLIPGADRDPMIMPLRSLARLVDGEPDPASPFASMIDCNGAAALWAALALPDMPPDAGPASDAIVRSFQALPPHLRRHLGPRLVALLLPHDEEAARMVRDALARTPDIPSGTVALIAAEVELGASRPENALDSAETAVLEDGSGLAGLATLVEAHFQSGQELAPEVALSVAALREVADEDAPKRDRAMVLALGLSGQMDEAFALAGPDHPAGADLWQVLVRLGSDDAFLAHAVLPPSTPAPPVADGVNLEISRRLDTLGFPEAALVWLGQVAPGSAAEERETAASARLALGDARETLRLLGGLSSPQARALQAEAYKQLGTYGAARGIADGEGMAEEGARLAAWEGDWDLLARQGSPIWAEAAARVTPAPPEAAGPLAEGLAALEDSAAARAAIMGLLAEVPAVDQ